MPRTGPTIRPNSGLPPASAAGRGLALDCGCGTGQLSLLLADEFDRVIATDASAQQIAAATPHPRIDYRVAPAEASGLDAGTVDLIVAAQAAHWFDLDAFYREARRVAKPGALIALVTYGVFHIEGDAEPVVQYFYWNTIGLIGRQSAAMSRRAIARWPFLSPNPGAGPGDRAALDARSVSRLCRDLVSGARGGKRGHRVLVEDFAKALTALWPDGERRLVRWPITVRAGRVRAASRL